MRLGEKKRVKAIQKEQNNKKESVKNFYRSKLGDFLPSDLQFLKDLYELNKHRTNYNCRILYQDNDSMDISRFNKIQIGITQIIAQYCLVNYHFIINFELLNFNKVCKITFEPIFYEVIDEMFRGN